MSSLWQEATNPADGRIYYYNTQTKETQWTKPVELMTPVERALQNTPWKEYSAEGGRKYWYNTETKQSVWEMPDVLKAALERNNIHSLPAAPTFVAGGPASYNHSHDEGSSNRQMAVYGQSQPGDSGMDSGSKSLQLPSTDNKDEPHYSTQDEAEAAFIKLLRRSGVGADWTWEQTMRAVIKEPQYRALKDPKDRKAAFEKFTVELRAQEVEKAKDRMTKLRQDFSTMLKSHPEIKYYTRWKTALSIIEKETIFRSAADDIERRQLYDEYIAELWKAEVEREAAARKEGMEELSNLLKSLNLEPYTRWSEAQTIIQQHERFKYEEVFRALTKLDILNTFESHIKQLERAFNDQKQRAKSLKMRRERKHREAFVELLDKLRSEGHIRAGTKWMHIHPLIKDDPRYTNMLGQPGSTPLDLFWDKMEEVDRDIRLKKNFLLDVIEEKRFEISHKTTFDEFAAFVRTDSRTASLDHDTLVVLFDKLREKVVKRVEDDRHQAERHLRRRMDALRSILKHLEPPVEVTDSWEQVRPRIQKLEEFQALETEELRRQAFDKFIRRLKEKQEEREKDIERRERKEKDREREKEKEKEKEKEREKLPRSDRDRIDRERERERERSHRDRDRDSDLGRNSHHYHRSSRHPRDREGSHGHRSRSPPEPDMYEAERRRAAGERERQYLRSGRNRSTSRHRDRHERASSRTSTSHYDRERREREEERERQYRLRGIDRDAGLQYDDRVSVRRRVRGSSVESEEGNRRDTKRSRRERTPHTPNHQTSKPPVDASRPGKIEEKGEESEEGEIAE
ncbi:hypothetical protein BDZ91DRAFT_689892 [Kalaharituber pfeilii]|nr:hypothetical protein BDZ91DRAFT_689892 [Kalaharituber pfeilii]